MSGEPMTDPTPYVPEEGAGIYRLCDVPEGWEYRYRKHDPWHKCEAPSGLTPLVEARPPRPVMVEVSADEVIERLGRGEMKRVARFGDVAGQRLLDAAWAEKDAAS